MTVKMSCDFNRRGKHHERQRERGREGENFAKS